MRGTGSGTQHGRPHLKEIHDNLIKKIARTSFPDLNNTYDLALGLS